MGKPIIGIVGKPFPRKESLWKRYTIIDEFRCLIVKKGGIPIGVLPTEGISESGEEEEEDLYEILSKCDGFILQGGIVSAEYEIQVAKYAIDNDIPIIGTCAGFNNLIYALGGNTQKEMHEEHNIYDKNYRHKVKIERNSKLYDIFKMDEIEVNSIHTYVAKDEDIKQYKITAHSEDGLVEAIELEGKKFVVGVKWHPEIMADVDTKMDDLFTSFIELCKK